MDTMTAEELGIEVLAGPDRFVTVDGYIHLPDTEDTIPDVSVCKSPSRDGEALILTERRVTEHGIALAKVAAFEAQNALMGGRIGMPVKGPGFRVDLTPHLATKMRDGILSVWRHERKTRSAPIAEGRRDMPTRLREAAYTSPDGTRIAFLYEPMSRETPPAHGNDFQITRKNAAVFERAYKALTENTEKFVEHTQEYPVECIIDGLRFVLRSREDIAGLIGQIQCKLEGL